MRRVSVIERADEFPQIRGLWEELVACSARTVQSSTGWKACAPTIFQSYAWNEIAARLFAERERPYVAVVESDSGAAIIPGCVRRDAVSLLGEELFDYRDAIWAGDESLTDLAWAKVRALGLPLEIKAVRGERGWAEMKPFAGAPWVPGSSPIKRNKSLERNLRRMAEQGCGSGYFASASSRDGLAAPAEALPPGSASPAAMAPLGVTSEKGRLAAEAIGVLRSAQDDNRPFLALVRRMYELKGQRESGSLFRDPWRIEAVVQMAATAPAELFTIENGGEFVAAVLTFIDGQVCRFYGTYYDERWARFSPGVSLLYRVVQEAQRRGLDFDFMTGEQGYKMRFASEVVPLYIAQVPVADSIAA